MDNKKKYENMKSISSKFDYDKPHTEINPESDRWAPNKNDSQIPRMNM